MTLYWTKNGATYGLRLEAPWQPGKLGQFDFDKLNEVILGKQRIRAEDLTIGSLTLKLTKLAVKTEEKKVTQADVRRFLDRSKVSLSYPMLREVWKRVNQTIKSQTSETAQSSAQNNTSKRDKRTKEVKRK